MLRKSFHLTTSSLTLTFYHQNIAALALAHTLA